ncbi:YceI family protein [Roseibacillus ishigakijimensis]|uniref:YceI family protein n=1 Tax=Roseibacillus ishigakijimensis TaxID=454146 RepID=A0A934RW10_9BACT|nr:YceI family protein [Roseibacillus ishigakijimensis]MBK1835185.1 YceI family protein [Roseibacillus ishigakijimensis]
MSSVLLDVRLADDYEARHLAGAVNQPVFEVQFPDEIQKRFPDRETAFRVYGADGTSLEAEMAAEKLRRLGYKEVTLVEGGLAGREQAGDAVETGTPLPTPPQAPEGRQALDLEASQVHWTGRNLLNAHHGSVAIAEGFLEFSGGALTGGDILLDLARMDCFDLAGGPMHDVLIAHLHNDDFLDLEKFPNARLKITGCREISSHPGAVNHEIAAELTLKGVTHPLTFPASCGITPEGQAAAQATFSLDRTRWGINYGSGKLFHRLAGHLVNDEIEFQVKIVTLAPDGQGQ